MSIYKSLRWVIGGLTREFFSEVRLSGAAPEEEGPLLIVVNHPNMALDSFLVAQSFKRELWFIAKSTLFSSPFLTRFFEACHMIPVVRRQDRPGSSGVENREMFSKVVDILCRSKAVVIFPEGVSLGERKLQPIKTGAARIAFQAEEARGFNLGVKIQAVGLTYSRINAFKSRVSISFAEPLYLNEFRAAYESDAQAAVKILTKRIAEELGKVTVQVEEQSHADLVEKISDIYRYQDGGLDQRELMDAIARNLQRLSDKDWQESRSIRQKIDAYSYLASLFGLNGSVELERPLNQLVLFVSSPLILLAFLINVLPYKLTSYWIGRYAEGERKSAAGIFTIGSLVFACWYLLCGISGYILFGAYWALLLGMIISAASGYMLNRYAGHIKLWLISHLWPSRIKPIHLLRIMRDELINELNSMRKE